MKNTIMNRKFTLVLVVLFSIQYSCHTDKNKMIDDKFHNNDTLSVKIENQIWMQQNLNINTEHGSKCFNDHVENCNKFGMLYNWETALTICPEGWRLPTRDDFELLINNYETLDDAYNQLKDGGQSGFNAVLDTPFNFPLFGLIGINSYWWTSDDNEDGLVLQFFMSCEKVDMAFLYLSKETFASVRCIKN